MLFDEKKENQEVFIKNLNRIENKYSLNVKMLKLYKEKKELREISKEKIEFSDFIIRDFVDIKTLENLILGNEKLDVNIINEILSKNKYSEEEITNFIEKIMENVSNKDNLNCLNFIKTNKIIFTEANIKKLIHFYDYKIFLSKQKEIDFLLKNEEVFVIDILFFKNNFLNNTNYFTLENTKKFLNNYINESKNENIKNQKNTELKKFFEIIPLDDEILTKYKKVMFMDDVLKNQNLTEELIKKHCKDCDLRLLNNKIKLSKIFIKKNLKNRLESFIPHNVFSQLNNKKDVFEIYEIYLNGMMKDEVYLKNIKNNVTALLRTINSNHKYDFDVYEELIEKRKNIIEKNIEINSLDKILLFNENTTSKHFKILEDILPLPKHPYDYESENVRKTILNDNTRNIVISLSKSTNIPDDILIKYLPYFTVKDVNYDNGNFIKGSFENLMFRQRIPEKLKTKDMFYDKLKNMSDVMTYIDQIETKEESKIIIRKINELNNEEKHWFTNENFYRFLLNNSRYLENVDYEEKQFLFKNSNIANSKNNYKLFGIFNVLQEEKIRKIKNKNNEIDYGLRL